MSALEKKQNFDLASSNAINELGAAMMELPNQINLPLNHYFTHGLYGRQIFMPAGSVVVSKIHLQDHITVILQGKAKVVGNDASSQIIQAPDVFITKANTQRALYIIEDCIWLTVHATNAQTVEEFENTLVENPWFLQDKEVLKCQ